MERVSTCKNSRLQTIRQCLSDAYQQTRESEIEVPSKRRFRQIYGDGNDPAPDREDSNLGKKGFAATR